MNKNILYKDNEKKNLSHKILAFTLPYRLVDKLNAFNEVVEHSSSLIVGRSFIVRFALEELFRRQDAREAVIERKIDNIRAKQLI